MLLLLATMLAFGCGDDDEDDATGPGSGKPPAGMIGSWTFDSVTVDGTLDTLASVLEWKPAAVGARMDIQANSAYVYDEVDAGGGQIWFESGFVFVDGSEIDINTLLDGDGAVNETSFLTFTLGTDVMTLREVYMGKTNVFFMSK